jgi:hypothetical protein
MALGEITLSDGTTTINFHPGASTKRTLDKTDGLMIIPVGRQSTPKCKSVKRSRDLFVVNATFQNRFSEYQSLFSMVKEETNSTNNKYTFVRGIESFTVTVRQLIESSESGEGELNYIEVEMEVVQA